jgi:serine/threonine protein kinase
MNTNHLFFKMLEGQNIDNKYYLKSLLGVGGFGGVYLADEVVRDRKIRSLAVKLIITDNPDKQLEELIISTTLKHPNLLDCYTCGESKINGTDFLYLLMEQAELSLEDKLKQEKLSETEAEKVILDIAKALEFLHNRNPIIVHRDLKPGNVLKVGENWKLSDFGLVRAMQNTATKTTTIMGSSGYAPPEAYQGKISSAWDIWSLGVLIYEVLTGELPFNSDTPLALMQQVIKEQPDLNKLPENWREIVGKCLEKESVNRLKPSELIRKINYKTSLKEQSLPVSSNPYYSHFEKENKSIEINPNDPSAYLLRGNGYSFFKQYSEALSDYNKAIEINPNDPSAYLVRGFVYSNLQKYPEAIADYTKAIEIDPDEYPNAYSGRANAYYYLQKYPEAIADYTKAIEIDPDEATYSYLWRSFAYKNLQKYSEAKKDLQQAANLFKQEGYEIDYQKVINILNKLP